MDKKIQKFWYQTYNEILFDFNVYNFADLGYLFLENRALIYLHARFSLL